MLTITIPGFEQYDEKTQSFILAEETTLRLEHSLVSISKWESKWQKPFLSKDDKTTEETIDYIRCMCTDENVDSNIFYNITNDNMQAINDYIGSSMTATTFREEKGKKGFREIITSELIYYWMVALNIPFECQYWHLNRLLTLVRVCNIKNDPPKKRSMSSIMRDNTALNAQRRAKMNTKG